MKEFSPAELERFDGKDGRPCYVIHEGRVYDVSESKLWKDGLHMRRHRAGNDLTVDLQAAPHGVDRLERYPQVGTMRPAEAGVGETPLPAVIALLLERNPFFRRHPHPMTIHFPIAFMLAAPSFLLLYLVTGVHAFETTAFHCLGGGLLFTLVGIATGLITWKYNYMGKMMKPVAIKLPLSLVMLGLTAVAFFWRLSAPGIMLGQQGVEILYPVIVFAQAPIISVIGWYGATMTFPIEKE